MKHLSMWTVGFEGDQAGSSRRLFGDELVSDCDQVMLQVLCNPEG